jgi:hypothetical protein
MLAISCGAQMIWFVIFEHGRLAGIVSVSGFSYKVSLRTSNEAVTHDIGVYIAGLASVACAAGWCLGI